MFLKPFKKRTFGIEDKNEIKLPRDFQLFDIKDWYYWCVCNFGISEKLFWNADISFLQGVVADKQAYDQWLSYQIKRRKS